ncbi:MAG: 50S ribosomal protein L11 methyltransferase [Firmicutes bacterium]|nr:50S ribosomal protein L11 methyltransferase [Bacillota bacterium]NLL88355.1 50S ribosomal protein L11 methyltransferase [Bacillota bacterium]
MGKQWQEVAALTHQEAAEAAGEIMLRYGAQGVAFESDALIREAMANQWGDYFPELSGDQRVMIKAYFHVPKNAAQLNQIQREIEALSGFGLQVGQVELTARIISEADWADAWKQYYHPVRIGRVVIEPSWEPMANPQADAVVVVLDPGMAFGTGTHPTTAMCIEALQDHSLQGRTVWDIGTGSGILAITAAKLGAGEVRAVDTDPVAVEVCRENAARNGVEISCGRGSLPGLPGKADLIVANIIADVIIELMPAAAAKLTSRGVFLASGVIHSRAADVANAASENGFTVTRRMEQGEWVCFELQQRRTG